MAFQCCVTAAVTYLHVQKYSMVWYGVVCPCTVWKTGENSTIKYYWFKYKNYFTAGKYGSGLLITENTLTLSYPYKIWSRKLMPRNADQSHSSRAYSEGCKKWLDRNTEQMLFGYFFTPPDKHTSPHYHQTIFYTCHMVKNGELILLPYE